MKKGYVYSIVLKRLFSLFIASVSMLVVSSACQETPSNLTSEEPIQPTVSTDHPAPSSTDANTASSMILVGKDLVYSNSLTEAGEADKDWTLDIHTPTEGTGRPVIVLLHGFAASKEKYSRLSHSMAEQGMVVYTINAPVRTTPTMAVKNGKGFREFFEVLSCAIGYARSTASDYGGHSDRVVLVAHSWGSLYGSWFALAYDQLAADWDAYALGHEGPASQAACAMETNSDQIAGFIGIGGGRYTDAEQYQDSDPELWKMVSPFSYFGQNQNLPIRLLHGETDGIASPETSQNFNKALLEAGYDSHLRLFDGGHIVPVDLTIEAVLEIVGN